MKKITIIIACLLSMNAMAQNTTKFEIMESTFIISFNAEVLKGTMNVIDTTFTAKGNKALRTVRTQFKTVHNKLMETKVTEAWDDRLKSWSLHSGSMEPVDLMSGTLKFTDQSGGITKYYVRP